MRSFKNYVIWQDKCLVVRLSLKNLIIFILSVSLMSEVLKDYYYYQIFLSMFLLSFFHL